MADDNKTKRTDSSLIKALIQTEAEIDRAELEKSQADKRTRQIKSSKTYKSAGPLKNLGSKNRHQEEIRMLEAELAAVKNELRETKEALQQARLDGVSMNSIKVQKSVREMKNDASLMNYIEKAVVRKQQHDKNYNDALTYAGRLFMNERDAYRRTVYETLLQGLKIEDIPEFMMREAFTDNVQLSHAASFRASLNMRIRQSQLFGTLPEYILDDKKAAYEFMDKLNIRRPWTSEKSFKADELEIDPSTVVKPADGAGARGVYLIHDFSDIIDLKRARKLDSKEALRSSMKEDLDTGRVSEDDWMTEELILEDKENKTPGSDIKFYCFYGKVGLVLEINRYPELKYCWWTADGERVRTGKYDNEPFLGEGVTPSEIEMASKISKEIPAPFIRIDFLKSEDGLVFGEFTPKPGNYDEFDKETDQWMGDFFLEAEARLTYDLINHEAFTTYMESRQG
ncbi:TupA-like ATPgrasp [Lacicoccus qingdaonensis]|uniref:TupA-like ATPgrasp n=2 Tax=Lacicoccus qingdaonensis TaxID=576118 RepID=A0A1G9F6W1_9BACL|nr:TupA-like ATPgrasp [Salinicoccus qingdaonensis]